MCALGVDSSVAGLIWVRHGGRQVHPWSLDYMGCILGIEGIVRGCSIDWGGRPVRPGSLGCALVVVGFIRGR